MCPLPLMLLIKILVLLRNTLFGSELAAFGECLLRTTMKGFLRIIIEALEQRQVVKWV
jgi:hypothetical protein